MTDLDRIFRPRSVAIIGASTDPRKVGGRPLHFLKKHGFNGDIWPVNPRKDQIEGFQCFPNIESLPGVPDVAVILLGPSLVIPAVKELSEMGCGGAIILTGGFAEAGENGKERQKSLKTAAASMRLLGPNTIGLLNLRNGVILSASGALDEKSLQSGSVAVVSQSGGILGSLFSRAAARGIGLSYLAATGNEVDIEVSDVMAFLSDDEETKAVAVYLETLRNPEAFREAASLLSTAGKKLIVYKVGRSETGAQAAASHTGALVGEDGLFDAFFRQVGAIRVKRYSDLIDLASGLSLTPIVKGNRLAILTHTGGAAGLVADLCGIVGFETPAPSLETAGKLRRLLEDEGFAPDRNPVDLTLSGLDPEIVYRAIITLSTSNEYDSIVAVVGSSSVGRPYMVADPVIRAAATEDLPIVVYTSAHTPAIVTKLNGKGVAVFDAPEACASLLAASLQPDGENNERAPALVEPINLPTVSGQLNELECREIFASFGIPAVKAIGIKNSAEGPDAASTLGDSVVIKILSREILHKTEIGGVKIGVSSRNCEKACDDIASAVNRHGISTNEGFIIQENLSGATEMIIGFYNDPVLGPAIMIGAGGTRAELLNDTASCVLPVSVADIRTMLASLRMFPLLKGYRGSTAANIDGLVEIIARFAHMCGCLGSRLVEAEINPLFVDDKEILPRAGDGILIFSN